MATQTIKDFTEEANKRLEALGGKTLKDDNLTIGEWYKHTEGEINRLTDIHNESIESEGTIKGMVHLINNQLTTLERKTN